GVAVSDNGTALVGWSELTSDGSALNYYAARFDGTSWNTTKSLGTWTTYPPTDAQDVATATNNKGDGIIFYGAIIPGTTTGAMYPVCVDGTTGTFSAPVQVSTAANYAPGPWKALLDDQGNAYIMEGRGVFRLAAGSNSYDATGLACACNNNTG